MRRFTRSIGIIISIFLLVAPVAATVHNVAVANFAFTPASITIAQGDTVVWTNNQGFHNVHHTGIPSLFGNAPANAPWTYTFVFNLAAGAYSYDCEIHPTQMTGTVTVQAPSDAPERPSSPLSLELSQNFPNPFNSRTFIQFSLPAEMDVKLTVLNVLGQTVAELYDGRLEQGAHSISFEAQGISSGMYYYKLQTPVGTVARKMFYVK